ncbi:hypothetical protein HYFRA_00005213 [Hymenoscyphus fraxineus]|uniref:Uncharacterized protein n=1 Tax=Hymenoscyphus fraxineus TaxID=746836 RepID=A0A9N9Q073_9HELO|nr:hypothetical protein HYFRA_00005213 [Hymenoscyphus fraxineus]
MGISGITHAQNLSNYRKARSFKERHSILISENCQRQNLAEGQSLHSPNQQLFKDKIAGKENTVAIQQVPTKTNKRVGLYQRIASRAAFKIVV